MSTVFINFLLKVLNGMLICSKMDLYNGIVVIFMSLGTRLKKEREKRNWSQIYVAKKIGITNAVLSNYERDYRDPDTATLKKIAELYEVSVDYHLGHEVEEELTYYKNKIATEFPDIDLMFKDMESLTADDLKEVYEFIKFKKSQKKSEE